MSRNQLRAGAALTGALAWLFLLGSRGESLASRSSLLPATSSCRLAVHVRDRNGKPIVARVRVAPSHWRERVRLGMSADLQRVATAGNAELELQPGAYRVWISRGPEWSIVEFALHAEPGARIARMVELEHEVALAEWHGAELHVHTRQSPDAAAHGGVSASELLAEGIELAVATDHNHIGVLEDEIESVAGAEITTWAPEIGHFNAFPLQKLPRWRGTIPTAIVHELTRDPQVFVQVNHPRLEDHIAYFALGGFDGRGFTRPGYHLRVHGLEVWNGYDLSRPERVHALLGEWRRWIARGQQLTATGGSDSHGAPGHVPGYPRTYTRATRAAALAPELRAGRAFVSNGPLLELLVEGRTPGESATLVASRPVAVSLQLRAASWLRVQTLELYADDRVIWTSRVPAARHGRALDFRVDVRVRTGAARVLHAVARGGTGLERLLGRDGVEPLAFTNAVRLTHASPGRAPE